MAKDKTYTIDLGIAKYEVDEEIYKIYKKGLESGDLKGLLKTLNEKYGKDL